MTSRSRDRFWTLAALALLLAAPPWMGTVVFGAAIGVVALRTVRLLANARPSRSRPAPDEIPLGVGRSGRQVVVRERELSAHGLILGASGSGKTTTLMTRIRTL